MTKSNLFISEILADNGPMRASRLADILIDELELSPQAAVKRISRTSSPVHKITGILPKNEYFLYNQRDWGSARYWHALKHALRETKSIYSHALDAIEAKGGLIQCASFDVICGSPTMWSKQVPAHVVLTNLKRIGLIEAIEIGKLGECLRLKHASFQIINPQRFRGIKVAEDIQADALREWARKLGVVSYNSAIIRDNNQAPSYGNFHWDLVGPCYLLPLVSRTEAKPKPGFFVADVFCGTRLDERNISYFLRKVRMLQSRSRGGMFLPLILADSFTRDALRLGKQAGLIMATTRNLFGDAAAQALESLLQVLTRVAESAEVDPEYITELFSKLGAIEGAAGNLRGALFEMIVGYLVRELEGGSVEIGEIVRDERSDQSVEIDVLRKKGKIELCFYECRVRNSKFPIKQDEIKKWIKSVDRVKQIFNQRLRRQYSAQNARLRFEFWTTGKFDCDAWKLLESEKEIRTSISIDWKDGDCVRQYAKSAYRRTILDTLDEHYFNHPLV